MEVIETQRKNTLRAWTVLAVGALAIAGLYAPMLALSRLPGIEGLISWPTHAFEKGIITHVVFSIVVWYLAVFGALLTIGTPPDQNRRAGRFALFLVGAAFILLLVPSLMDRGQPSLNNYVPVIIDPVYYTGLLALFAALCIQVVGFLSAKSSADIPFPIFPLKASAVAYLAAMAAFVFSALLLGNQTPSESYNEDLFWAGGHILQFVNAGLMGAGTLVLADTKGGRLTKAAFWLLGGGAMGALALFIVTDLTDGSQRIGFSHLKYLLALPASLMAVDLFHRRNTWLQSGFPAYVIILAALTFGVGGAFGFFVDGADTRTPAHYHGVLGGVNLIFFGLFFSLFLPKLGRAVKIGRAVYALIGLYAAGQTLQCVGLFMAGGYGTPRKTAGAAQGLEEIGAIAGMYLNGIGALIAIIGGVMFVVIAARALLSAPSTQAPSLKENP